MRVLLVVNVLVATCLLLSEGSDRVHKLLNMYKQQILHVNSVITNQCPRVSTSAPTLSVVDEASRGVDAVKKYFEKQLELRLRCRAARFWTQAITTLLPVSQPKNSIASSGVSSIDSTTEQTTATTTNKTNQTNTNQLVKTTAKQVTSTIAKLTTPVITKQTTFTATKKTTPKTTTVSTQPVECQLAVNYTQSWRRDHKGSDIRPGGLYSNGGYACDLHNNLTQWFRFSGDAGTHMLDSCPKWKSCGTYYPLWTDEKMPTQIGVVNTIYIYGVWKNDCKWVLREISVMRCSWDSPNDLIYNGLGLDTRACSEAFCGIM